MSNKKNEEFLIVYWSKNKIYTIIVNFKGVNQGDEVISFVNYTKDHGAVLFTGSEQECKQELNKYRDKSDKSKRTRSESFKEKINNGPLKFIINRYRNWSGKDTHSIQDPDPKDKQSLLSKNTVSKGEQLSIKSYDKKDETKFFNGNMFYENETKLNSKAEGPQKCKNCIFLQNKIDKLKAQEARYVNLLKVPPYILNRFERLKNERQNNLLDLRKPKIKITHS